MYIWTFCITRQGVFFPLLCFPHYKSIKSERFLDFVRCLLYCVSLYVKAKLIKIGIYVSMFEFNDLEDTLHNIEIGLDKQWNVMFRVSICDWWRGYNDNINEIHTGTHIFIPPDWLTRNIHTYIENVWRSNFMAMTKPHKKSLA